MGAEEKVNEVFLEELSKCMEGEKLVSLPIVIKVEQDDVSDIERWKQHE